MKREVFGLLGPNGAGKTTTISMLTGLLPRTSGLVTVDGLDLQKDTNAVKAKLGLVPQELALYPMLSARDNLNVFGRIYGLRGKRLASAWTPCWTCWSARWPGRASKPARLALCWASSRWWRAAPSPLAALPFRSEGFSFYLSQLTPHAHAIDAYLKLMSEGAGLMQVLPNILSWRLSRSPFSCYRCGASGLNSTCPDLRSRL